MCEQNRTVHEDSERRSNNNEQYWKTIKESQEERESGTSLLEFTWAFAFKTALKLNCPIKLARSKNTSTLSNRCGELWMIRREDVRLKTFGCQNGNCCKILRMCCEVTGGWTKVETEMISLNCDSQIENFRIFGKICGLLLFGGESKWANDAVTVQCQIRGQNKTVN